MNQFLQNLEAILRALPRDPVAVIALSLLVLAFVMYIALREKDTARYRYAALVLLICAVLLTTSRLGETAGLFNRAIGARFEIPAGSQQLVVDQPEGVATYTFSNSGAVQYDVERVNRAGTGKEVVTINPGETNVAVQKASIHGSLFVVAKTSGPAEGTYRRVD